MPGTKYTFAFNYHSSQDKQSNNDSNNEPPNDCGEGRKTQARWHHHWRVYTGLLEYPTGKNRLNSHHGFYCCCLQSTSHEVALWVCWFVEVGTYCVHSRRWSRPSTQGSLWQEENGQRSHYRQRLTSCCHSPWLCFLYICRMERGHSIGLAKNSLEKHNLLQWVAAYEHDIKSWSRLVTYFVHALQGESMLEEKNPSSHSRHSGSKKQCIDYIDQFDFIQVWSTHKHLHCVPCVTVHRFPETNVTFASGRVVLPANEPFMAAAFGVFSVGTRDFYFAPWSENKKTIKILFYNNKCICMRVTNTMVI